MTDTRDWISVGALSEAFGPRANLLPSSRGLQNRELTLHPQNGSPIHLHFHAKTLTRGVLHQEPGALEVPASPIPYSATEIRSGVFFVDFADGHERQSTTGFVLDLSRGIFTGVLGELPASEEAREPMLQRIA